MPSIMMATVAGEIAARIGREIVVRHMPETGHHRLETFFDFVLAGGGDGRQRAAVKGIDRR